MDQDTLSLYVQMFNSTVVIIPVFFCLPVILGTSQELYFKERVVKVYETLLTTPITIREVWLSKTMTIAITGTIFYICVASMFFFSVMFFMPNIYRIVAQASIYAIAGSFYIACVAVLVFTSLVGFMYLRFNNPLAVQPLPVFLNIALIFIYFFVWKYIPDLGVGLYAILATAIGIVSLSAIHALVRKISPERLIIG